MSFFLDNTVLEICCGRMLGDTRRRRTEKMERRDTVNLQYSHDCKQKITEIHRKIKEIQCTSSFIPYSQDMNDRWTDRRPRAAPFNHSWVANMQAAQTAYFQQDWSFGRQYRWSHGPTYVPRQNHAQKPQNHRNGHWNTFNGGVSYGIPRAHTQPAGKPDGSRNKSGWDASSQYQRQHNGNYSGHPYSGSRGSRWNHEYAEKLGNLRQSDERRGQTLTCTRDGEKRPFWDSDSDGLSDAESSTSKGSDEKCLQQLPLPPWLPSNYHKNLPQQVAPAPLNSHCLEALSEELTLFATWAQPQPDEVRVRRMVESHITGLVSQLWPTAKVELFGSSGLLICASSLALIHCFRPLPKHWVSRISCVLVMCCRIRCRKYWVDRVVTHPSLPPKAVTYLWQEQHKSPTKCILLAAAKLSVAATPRFRTSLYNFIQLAVVKITNQNRWRDEFWYT